MSQKDVDVRDPFYAIGYKYNKRVWLVDPQGVITVISLEEYHKIRGDRKNEVEIKIRRRGESNKTQNNSG